MTPKEMYDRLYDDDDIFDEFVEQWMKKHPDRVKELVSEWLDMRIGSETWSDEATEYTDFVMKKVEEKVADIADRKYHEMKDMERN